MKKYLELLDLWKPLLTKIDQENLHFKSMKNFLIHFDGLKDDSEKETVRNLIDEYFEELGKQEFSVDIEEGREIAAKYIDKIGMRYSFQLGFKRWTKFSSLLFFAVLGDLFLLLMGFLARVNYIPIVTLLLIAYAGYIHWVYGRRNKLYGPRF